MGTDPVLVIGADRGVIGSWSVRNLIDEGLALNWQIGRVLAFNRWSGWMDREIGPGLTLDLD